MKSWIDNKIVIISGVSSGIGFSITKYLIEKHNCKVIGIARNEKKLICNIKNITKNAENFSYKLFDVSIRQNWEDFRTYLESNNIVPDVIINNAGFMLPFEKAENYSFSEIEEITNTNFLSIVYSTKILLPLVNKSKTPAIINVSSSAGYTAVVGQSLYSATKFAVRGFTDCVRVENKGIYVCGIYPGFVKTDILSRVENGKQNSSLIEKVMMPLDKATKKIIRKIKRKRKNIVLGFDGTFLHFGSRFFPQFTSKIMAFVLKKANLDITKNVFK